MNAEIEKLAVLSDTRRAVTELYKLVYPNEQQAFLIKKTTDVGDTGLRTSKIVLTATAAQNLAMALLQALGMKEGR